MKRLLTVIALLLPFGSASAEELTTAEKDFIHLLVAHQECGITLSPAIENKIVSDAWESSSIMNQDEFTSMIALRAVNTTKALKQMGKLKQFCVITYEVYQERNLL